MRVVANERLSRQTLAARWRELSGDPNAPERCELDEFGELQVRPPPSYRHQRIVAALMRRIEATLGGEVGSYAIASAEGGRIPDLCWAPSFDKLAREGWADPLTKMPPLCVDVLAPRNRRKDISEKVGAYLAAGAQEVILVETDARIHYFTMAGEQPGSAFGLRLTLPPGTYPL